MIIEGNKLRPSEGFEWITNGYVWSKLVYLGKNDRPDNWHDSNDRPVPPPEPEPEPEATAEDYENALEVFGV